LGRVRRGDVEGGRREIERMRRRPGGEGLKRKRRRRRRRKEQVGLPSSLSPFLPPSLHPSLLPSLALALSFGNGLRLPHKHRLVVGTPGKFAKGV